MCSGQHAGSGMLPWMFVFDTRHAPLCLQAFPAAYTFEEVCAHFDEVEAYYRSLPADAPASLIADARSLVLVDARSRRRVAQSFETLSPLLEHRTVAHAVVHSSPVVRNALTGIFWLKRPPWKIKAFSGMEEADTWVRARFRARGFGDVSAPAGWWREGVMAKLHAQSA